MSTAKGDDLKPVARRALASLDLTNLNDDCTTEDVRELCARARGPHGKVAGVCIWPQFVKVAKTILTGSGVRVVTVVAFPKGTETASLAMEQTAAAVEDGADEIDMVIPYRGLMEGHPELVPARVSRIKSAAGAVPVKAILETGVLGDAALIKQASELAIEGGADFIKTSTGKVPVNATPEAARVMLEVIAAQSETVGLKPAGGVRTTEDAAVYFDMCDEIMGAGWATPAHFRIGASSVLDALTATLEGRQGNGASGSY